MARVYNIGSQPVIIAHRGGATEFTENSIEAFQHTVAQGFRFIESDVHATRDGIPVIHHDPVIRGEGGTELLAINTLTWKELQRFQDSDGTLPRLEDVLDAFPDVVFNLDAKSDEAVEPLARAIRHTSCEKRVCLASFKQKRIDQMRALVPGAAFSLGTSEVARLVLRSKFPRRKTDLSPRFPHPDRGFQALQIPVDMRIAVPGKLGEYIYTTVKVATPELVRFAHAQGLAVHVWTINSEREAQGLIDIGVDGIITDIPIKMRTHFLDSGVEIDY